MHNSPPKRVSLIKEMFKAVKSGNLPKMREILTADRSLIHARDKDDSTPLHWAAWKGYVEVVRHLLEAGADVNARNRNSHWGTTPLHAAAHGGQANVARLLLAHGANMKAKNLNGRTPLGETTIHNAEAVAALLRERGARE